LLGNPAKFVDKTREVLQSDFGVPLPSDNRRRNAGKRIVGARKVARVSQPAKIVPTENRRDPALPLPPISASELENVC